jgi:hypothetical protein
MYTLIIASVAVALVAFIIYALERKSKSEPIVWEHAAKISVVGGLLTAGVVFSTTADIIPNIVTETVPSVAATASAVQEMFVGAPSF